MNHNRAAIISLLLHRHKLPKDSVAMDYSELISTFVRLSDEHRYVGLWCGLINSFDLNNEPHISDRLLSEELQWLYYNDGNSPRYQEMVDDNEHQLQFLTFGKNIFENS